MYTHCPNCDSHFEITQEYLDIANGKVRCGNCGHIFNALENLYKKQPEAETVHDEESSQLDTDTAPDKEADAPDDQAPMSSGFDIKSKMERIAASLSAATQELKTARKSTTFDAASINKSNADKDDSSRLSEIRGSLTPGEDAAPDEAPLTVEDQAAPVEAPLTVEDQAPSEEAPLTVEDQASPVEAPLTVEEQASPVEAPLTVEEQAVTVEAPSIVEEQAAPVEAPLTVEEQAAPVEAPLTVEKQAAPVEAPLTDEEHATSMAEPSEPEIPEEELDLIDFHDEVEDEDSYSTPLSDFTSRKVDQDDIDILKSLIEEPEKQNNLKDDRLLDELDNINQTLSDETDSLDERLSSSSDNFDDIDSGDDLLAELEQLERDFIKNDQISDNTSLDEAFSESDEFKAQQEFYDATLSDEEALKTDFSEDEKSVSDKELETEQKPSSQTSETLQEDEVVPSFLTQSESRASNPRTMFTWLAGTIVLLLVLAAQYLHVNSIKLAQNTTFRPLLESLCPMTGCALPLKKAPRKIITVNHDVRTHPSVNNALEIQLTFKNKATFTQGYPVLEIIFSNSRGEIIARRKFSPDEYLTADIQHAHGLKSNQSQDVKLKIVDPDPSSLLSFQFNYY